MPNFETYKEIAQARGALALELYVVVSTPVEGGASVPDTLPEHLEYQAELERSTRLMMAGPLSDLTGQSIEGAGLIIYRATSMDDARAIAAADPMHSKGARQFELRKWLVNEGSLTVSVGLSTGSTALL